MIETERMAIDDGLGSDGQHDVRLLQTPQNRSETFCPITHALLLQNRGRPRNEMPTNRHPRQHNDNERPRLAIGARSGIDFRSCNAR
jgi:hypothetical protein